MSEITEENNKPIEVKVEIKEEAAVEIKEETPAEVSPTVEKVHTQLLAIFDPENLKKDNFFRELVERTAEGWVPIKKMSMIKRFKEILEGDLSLFNQVAEYAPTEFELNADKTQLRCIKKEAEQVQNEYAVKATNVILSHIEVQNKRSIYSKGFPVENHASEDELKEFYSKYGRVVALRLRREGERNRDGKFKGSIFVEFETPAIAQQVVDEATEFNGNPLTNMIKGDYVEMKKKEKFDGADYEFAKFNHRHLIEYSNGQEHRYKGIKDLIKTVHEYIGRLEPLKVEGTGVVELFKITPEEFLAKLPNQKIEEVNFFLVSSAARSIFNKAQKDAKASGGRGGRGGGRGGRGGSRGGGRGGKKRDGSQFARDANTVEVSNKRARPTPVENTGASVPIIATAADK